MDNNESANGGESSPETVIGRSSSEEERKRRQADTSGEYVTVGDSSSSLDTVTGQANTVVDFQSNVADVVSKSNAVKCQTDSSSSINTAGDRGIGDSAVGSYKEKKKGRFGTLKSSFRKEGGLFKIKKKSRPFDTEISIEAELEADEKEITRKANQQQVKEETEENRRTTSSSTASPDGSLKKKKKKGTARSLVRRLSLSKFRLSSTEQQQQQQQQHQSHDEHRTEARQTPEGGDSSRSLSQSSQESNSPSRSQRKKGVESKEEEKTSGFLSTRVGAELRKSETLIEKPVSTVTVVQRKSPSLTIRSNPAANLSSKNLQHDSRLRAQEASAAFPKQETICSSTLPYAISKWTDQKQTEGQNSNNSADTSEIFKRVKLAVKSDSESSITTKLPSPIAIRRKLSLLEEKRAIFQRRYFDTTKDTDSGETIIATSLDLEKEGQAEKEPNSTKKLARHISVRKFDSFSTFEGTFDEESGLGYLAGIKEDHTESCDQQNDDYGGQLAAMGPMVGETHNATRSISQDSASSQNNASNANVGEKREHLYKILVIGELGAGKTSIIKRYVHQFFSQHYRATIGVDFALKVLNWDPHTIIRLQLWDIAGQERFGNMTRVYYKEAVGAFIVFDVTRSATLDAVVKWKQDLDSKVQLPDGSPIPCVLLANKCDQQKEGLVNSPAKMDEYCKEKNFAGWFETSAKENINIEEAARFLVSKILQNEQIMKGNGVQEQNDGERFALNQSPSSSKKSCSC